MISIPSFANRILTKCVETGGLFRLLAKLLMTQTFRSVDKDLCDLANLLGRYFQIRDDYQNLKSTEVNKNCPHQKPNLKGLLLTLEIISIPYKKGFAKILTKENILSLSSTRFTWNQTICNSEGFLFSADWRASQQKHTSILCSRR